MSELTAWDDEMISLLQPLVEHGWTHHGVFFANTFPLLFHYAWALKKNEKVVRDFLRLGEWEAGWPEKTKHIEYKQPAHTEDNCENIIPVTTFTPKFVFVEATLSTIGFYTNALKVSESSQDNPVELCDFLSKVFPDKDGQGELAFDYVEVYAELEELSSLLTNLLKSALPTSLKPTVYLRSANLPLGYPFVERGHSTLRLFIYGAPLSVYLKRKTNHYLQLRLPSDTKNTNPTGIAFSSEPEECCKKAITDYHAKLYASACNPAPKNGECPPFFLVYRAYNEMAWLLQHRSSFHTPQEYAECLADHHSQPSTPAT